MRDCLSKSSNGLVLELLRAEGAITGDTGGAAGAGAKKVTKKQTLGGQFRNQLVGLVDTLRATTPHFIRCVKPNAAKKPNIFEGVLSLRQVEWKYAHHYITSIALGVLYAHPLTCMEFDP
jgi:myosin heavy subunit